MCKAELETRNKVAVVLQFIELFEVSIVFAAFSLQSVSISFTREKLAGGFQVLIVKRMCSSVLINNTYLFNEISLPKMTPHPHPQYSLGSPQPFNEEVSINLGRESNWNNKDDQEMFIYYISTT